VRGIGVAVSVSTSTVSRNRLRRSLCSTPNRCSSSMITSPRFRKRTSLLHEAVRADHDVHHAFGQVAEDALLFGGRRKRLSISIRIG